MQETRLYDADKGETRSMRSKEEANDYRYFPDPDLLPVEIDQAYVDAVCQESLPELPDVKAKRFTELQYGLSVYDAGVLTASAELADYYKRVLRISSGGKSDKNLGEARRQYRDRRPGQPAEPRWLDITAKPREPFKRGGDSPAREADNTISGKIAKDVLRGDAGEGSGHERAVVEQLGAEADHRRVGDRKRADQLVMAAPAGSGFWPTTARARRSSSASSSARYSRRPRRRQADRHDFRATLKKKLCG